MKPKKEAQEPQQDEFQGQGGAYEIDDETGKRRLVHRTQAPQQAPAPTETKE